ncbi:MAG: asparagine synthase (glutamine-hydrolyzing), partial [Thermoanaerobaculia bacterium]
MCGIVAILYRDGQRPVDQAVLGTMTDLLGHRGPDGRGLFIDHEVGLGHRRLAVLDLAGGHQPMRGPSGRTWIVYNGEVYNYQELRQCLAARGVRFRSHSDTEVLLAMYEQYGLRFVEWLNGMFAFAIWDERNRSLVLARDRLGVKPLYVWNGSDCIIAASEIKSILAYPGVPRELRDRALAEYVAFRQLSGGRTMFGGIDAVAPGTVEVHQGTKSMTSRFWSLPPADAAEGSLNTKRAAEELRLLLEDSVKLCMIADVPLGTFNSGGLDSSLVTALASRIANVRLRTFTIGFREEEYDERPFARRVSEYLSTVHEEVLGDASVFADALPQSIWHHDEPLNHANSIFIRLLSEFAKKKVTVVLTGEGADELFSGYPRYRMARVLGLTRSVAMWPERAISVVASLANGRKSRMIRLCLGQPDEFVIASNARYVLPEDVERLCEGESLDGRLDLVPRGRNLLGRTLTFDQATYLHNVLERMDKMTMAAGLEARVPFLDYRIVEFAAKLA